MHSQLLNGYNSVSAYTAQFTEVVRDGQMSLSTLIDPGLVREMLALRPGQHLCLIYEDSPLEQMPALLPFIGQGLAAGEQCVYIADDHTVDQVRDSMRAYGIDVEREEARGALQFWTRDEWRQPGELSSASKTAQVQDIVKKALAAEFSGIRFCVEMTWTLGPDIDTELLRHWEATVNEVFTPDVPGRVICQYSRKRLPPGVIEAALTTHPLAVIDSGVYPNPYYEGSRVLTAPSAPRSVEPSQVDWMISQIRWARAFEEERNARARVETALEQAETSRRRIEELYALAEQRSEDLHKAIAVKDEFLGLVSHELRTPIATVIGNGLLLQKRATLLQPEDREQALNDIVAEGQKLQRIIENLLLLTRSGSDMSSMLEPVSLTRQVEDLVESFKRHTPNRQVEVVQEGVVPVALAEPTFLAEVVENLLSNAHKYSPPNVPIEVQVGVSELGDPQLRVRDFGIGLAPDETERVFDAFYRSPASMNKSRGMGLGLAVCKRVVDAMGGRIWAVARAAGGSDFILTLQPADQMAGK